MKIIIDVKEDEFGRDIPKQVVEARVDKLLEYISKNENVLGMADVYVETKDGNRINNDY